jgi:hypothetical protein
MMPSMHPLAICTLVVTMGIITVLTWNVVTQQPFHETSQQEDQQIGRSSKIRGSSGTSASIQSSTTYTSLPIRDPEPSIQYNSTSDDQCHYFLAESAIPMSGLGLFTTQPIQKGEMSQSMVDICLYVADTPGRDYTHFVTHSWSRDAWLGTFEGTNPRAACEGFATLFNTMPPGVQTSKLLMTHPPKNYNHISRANHVTAGAITEYDGISSVATRDIPAGAEITIDYQEYVTI